MLSTVLLACVVSLSAVVFADGEDGAQVPVSSGLFDPRAYAKQSTVCHAVSRAGPEPVETEIFLEYVDINPAGRTTLLFVHGWPSLWSSWSNQILEFEHDPEYRLIIPNLRGFGRSTFPGNVQTSGSLPNVVGDLVCVLEHAGVAQAVCIGHDWGSEVCYEGARSRPDVITAVTGITVPYMPSSGTYLPISAFTPSFPHLTYQIYFGSNTSVAVTELNHDIRRTLRATLRTVASPPPETFLESDSNFLGAWASVAVIPPIPFMRAEEEDYLVEQYNIQKFNYTLEFYTNPNRYATWEFAHSQGNFTIPQPTLSILPTQDLVANWTLIAELLKSAEFIPKLQTETIDAAHWPQLERPKAVNAILKKWLKQLPPALKTGGPNHDEL